MAAQRIIDLRDGAPTPLPTEPSPRRSPTRGAERWKATATGTAAKLKRDHVSILAAGVGFYFMLALFPLAIAGVSLYGLISDPDDVTAFVDGLSGATPESMVNLLEAQLSSIAESSNGSMSLAFAASVLLSLWSASKGARALIEALNVVFGEEEGRGFLRLRLVALVFTALFVLVLGAAVALVAVLPAVLADLGAAGSLVTLVRWPLLALIAIVGLAVMYRYAPDRDAPSWRWVSAGAVVATVLWLLASGLFSLYARTFSSLNETYGSLTSVIVLLLWLYLTAFAILLGAAVDVVSRQASAGSARDEDAASTRDLVTARS
jgi:membrane protein